MAFDDMDSGGRMAFIAGTGRGIEKTIVLDLTGQGVDATSTGKTVGGRRDLPGIIVKTTEETREHGDSPIWCRLSVCDDAPA